MQELIHGLVTLAVYACVCLSTTCACACIICCYLFVGRCVVCNLFDIHGLPLDGSAEEQNQERQREGGELYVYIYIQMNTWMHVCTYITRTTHTRTHTWTRTADAGLGREKCVDPGAGPSRLGVPIKNSVHYVTSLDVKAPKCSDVEYCWIVFRSVAVSSVSVLYWEQLARAPVSPDGLDISTGRPQAGHMQSAMYGLTCHFPSQ